MWVLAELCGYVVNFDPYQGAKCGNIIGAADLITFRYFVVNLLL